MLSRLLILLPLVLRWIGLMELVEILLDEPDDSLQQYFLGEIVLVHQCR